MVSSEDESIVNIAYKILSVFDDNEVEIHSISTLSNELKTKDLISKIYDLFENGDEKISIFLPRQIGDQHK